MAEFKTLGQLAELGQAGDEQVFKDAYGDAPVLVIKSGTVSLASDFESRGEQHPSTGRWDLNAVAGKETSVGGIKNPIFSMAEAASHVVPVTKSGNNPFPGLVIVGRASSNDIWLSSSNVSKVHAYLREEDGGWVVQDRDSTNGTLVNHVKLESGQDHRLEFGDELQFGDVSSMFLDYAKLSVLCGLVRSRSS